MQTNRYSEGTRVEITRGRFPMAAALLGRSGLVVEVDDYRRGRYGVQLDGEVHLRDFAEDELKPLTATPKQPSDRGSAGPNIQG